MIADTAGEQDKTKLIDVQIPSSFRAGFGLQSNPDLIGKSVVASGSLAAYNNFAGLKNVTAISLSQDQPGDPGDIPDLPDGTGKKVLFDNAHGRHDVAIFIIMTRPKLHSEPTLIKGIWTAVYIDAFGYRFWSQSMPKLNLIQMVALKFSARVPGLFRAICEDIFFACLPSSRMYPKPE
ncbi:DUF6359 domain-containing protein [Paenibacillus barengoltzii]|uniref:DUF6359 domain-containing protein n=1 Tax=Paenibacillus barengoltzii TaxID=343517 RepID=UPI003F8CBF66